MKQVNIRNPFRMLVLMLGLFLSVGAFAQIDGRLPLPTSTVTSH